MSRRDAKSLRAMPQRSPARHFRDTMLGAPTGVSAGHDRDEFAETMKYERRRLLRGLPNVDGPVTKTQTQKLMRSMTVRSRGVTASGSVVEEEYCLPSGQVDVWLLPPKGRARRGTDYSDLTMRRM